MDGSMERVWHQLTWEEIGQIIADGMDAAILPVGATEQHGPHMGCGMDSELAGQLCKDVAAQTGVFLLPTLPYGCSVGHSHRWPGTLAVQPKTLIDLVKEIGDWVHSAGINRLFIINSHVTNAAPLRCALELLRAEHDGLMVAVINSAQISPRVRDVHHADGDDWHANAAETALMQYLAPELVREDKLSEADDPDRTTHCVFSHPVNRTSLNGVTGVPSKATAEDGRQLYEWMVADLSEKILRGLVEKPPLTHGYNDAVQFTKKAQSQKV